MEKKRTKIAYFTAVGVFLVLLVVLGLTYRETPLPTLEVEGEPVLADTPFAGTFWSLLPPIVAIVLVAFIIGGFIFLQVRKKNKK